uniref:AAA+ ATPase domain-containing protein n=1 Tax=Oryza glumipatula TaxID=40148 RepID=A0A0D9ZEL1_9ORYZ
MEATSSSSSLLNGLNSGVVLSLIAVLWTVVWQNLQRLQLQTLVGRHMNRHARRLAALVDPYLSVTIHEYEGGRMKRSAAYEEVKAYLSASSARDVRHLRAEGAKDADKLVLSMVDGEEVSDVVAADDSTDVTVWWCAYSTPPPRTDGGGYYGWGGGGRAQENRRYYRLFFLDRHRELVINTYLPSIRRQGRAVMVQNRQRKLFTNISTHNWSDVDGLVRSAWSHVVFEHPKTFDTLAMDPAKKKEIMDDLDITARSSTGESGRRGSGSTMVAAMANYLGYDVYDMELTSVHTNTDLRKLLIQTTSKSIIVIEDVDCSSNLTGRRKATGDGEDDDDDAKTTTKKVIDRGGGVGGDSKVTLSGLLNFIDGLWSAFGEERLIVLTTNHVEDLDPALIRTGRMDKKIEMSYCDFETFKSMAKIHLDVDDHEMFAAVERLLPEVDLVPADVGEHLTAKNPRDDAGACLARLVNALQEAKAKKDAAERQDEDNGVGFAALMPCLLPPSTFLIFLRYGPKACLV